MSRNEQKISVEGHQLTLRNLEKVFYPETGTTKAEVLDYYARIAPYLIRHAHDRIVTRKRWVDGVGTPDNPGKVFFEKGLPDYVPDWVPSRTIEHSNGPKQYPLLQDQATITYLVQLAALELHIPQWQVGSDTSDAGTISSDDRYPDRMVFDLDPGEGRKLADCIEVAHLIRELLNGMGLDAYPVTSGSKGVHLYAPLDGSATSQQISDVAHELASSLESDHPDLVVSAMKKSLRKNKVFIDWSQNSAAKTTIAPYSLRGTFTPTVATPRTWDEFDKPEDVEQLRFEEVLERLEDLGDLLEPLAQSAGEADTSAAEMAEDPLELYRSKRDPKRTSEPMPTSHTGSGQQLSFVIQEHHASTLHWDFRLEHDGVLASWALPKGPPTSPKQNRLAVQTEDHPLEYGTFEGTIPKGEYGGGEVTIWDTGTYELEKWRQGQEVIATLYGQPDGGLGGGMKKFALFNTGTSGPNKDPEKNWMIHLMDSNGSSSEQDGSTDEATSSQDTPEKAEPVEIAPMLASIGNVASVRRQANDWSFEMKWDGIRAIATVVAATQDSPGAVTLTSRNGKDMTATYPELAELAQCVEVDCVIDGEIVALGSSSRPDFGRLQRRMGLTKARDVEHERAKTPVYLMTFDLLRVQDDSLLRTPYTQRRQRLLDSVTESEHIYVPETFDGTLDEAMDSSRDLQLEGVMAKQHDSVYQPGHRTKTWLKLKHTSTRDVLIVGWRAGSGGRSDTFSSLLLAAHGDNGLVYMGRVGTGFDDHQLHTLRTKLNSISRKTPPVEVPAADRRDANWVRPSLVGEVRFAGITEAGRLRHPVWRGLRADIDPNDVTI